MSFPITPTHRWLHSETLSTLLVEPRRTTADLAARPGAVHATASPAARTPTSDAPDAPIAPVPIPEGNLLMFYALAVGRMCADGLLTRTRQPSSFASAAIVACLEQAWAAIRHHHPQIPAAVIVVAGSSTGNPGRSHGLVLGHFAALRWQHHHHRLSEVLISGEGLNRPATDILATLLHEAAHALAFARGIKDTSRQGRWHNHRFATLATELGLQASKHPKLGWSTTILRPETAQAYTGVLANLAAALTAYRHHEPVTETSGTDSSSRPSTVAAVCDCPRRIRITASVLDQGPITCGVCDNEFAPT